MAVEGERVCMKKIFQVGMELRYEAWSDGGVVYGEVPCQADQNNCCPCWGHNYVEKVIKFQYTS